MPVQKGKKRKRVRNRGPLEERRTAPAVARPAATPVAKPVRPRRGWGQLPPWVNALFGAAMLLVGLVFVLPQNMGVQNKLILLVGYVLLSAFYFFRAYRGYRSGSS